MSDHTLPVPPVALTILAEAGRLGGSNGRYEKFLSDLDGLYRDTAAYQARLAADDGEPGRSLPSPGAFTTKLAGGIASSKASTSSGPAVTT